MEMNLIIDTQPIADSLNNTDFVFNLESIVIDTQPLAEAFTNKDIPIQFHIDTTKYEAVFKEHTNHLLQAVLIFLTIIGTLLVICLFMKTSNEYYKLKERKRRSIIQEMDSVQID